jgi:hypothetical protein
MQICPRGPLDKYFTVISLLGLSEHFTTKELSDKILSYRRKETEDAIKRLA